MRIRIFSQKGRHTDDNRDVVTYTKSSCGTATLLIVLDGATSCPTSGDFSRELADYIINQFHTLSFTEFPNENCILETLKSAQKKLQNKFLGDFSSLLLALKIDVRLLVVHAGDCCLGIIDRAHKIEWLTSVHTIANALSAEPIEKIKNNPSRHTLTRNFKAKKYVKPDIEYFTLPNGTNLIIATDGFWAISSQEQSALTTQTLTTFDPEDDASFIILENEH